jgi:chitinase
MTMRSRCCALVVAPLALVALVAAPAVGLPGAPVDTTPPTAPTNLRVVDLGFNEATLAWNPSTDDSGSSVIYETEVVAPTDAQHWATLEPTRRYTLLRQGLTYVATVTALDGAHNRSEPATIRFTTPVDTVAPSVPTNLRFEERAGEPAGVIAWDPSVDNDAGSLVYDLWLQTPLSNGPVAHPRETSFSVDNLIARTLIIPGETYTLTVQARDAAGNVSRFSAPLTRTF